MALTGDMLSMIRTLGDQLRWARRMEVPDLDPAADLLMIGMGGSGTAGDFLTAIMGGSQARVSVVKGYAPLPGWAHRTKPLVVAISYSGDTEETLDAAAAADRAGLHVVAITTGGRLADLAVGAGWPLVEMPSGLQPRAAVGYLFGAVTRVAAAAGAVSSPDQALAEAADLVDSMTAEGSVSFEQAREIAGSLAGRVPIIYGGGPVSGVAARRWKTQVNENAKTPSWWSVLPELDHNELVGWMAMPELTRSHLGIVALTDVDDHPRVGIRLAHSRALTQDAVPWVGDVVSRGESALARLMSLTSVGDLTSHMLAKASGVDPVPVATIEKLKRLMTED